jgi:hypothetical protein
LNAAGGIAAHKSLDTAGLRLLCWQKKSLVCGAVDEFMARFELISSLDTGEFPHFEREIPHSRGKTSQLRRELMVIYLVGLGVVSLVVAAIQFSCLGSRKATQREA